MIVVAVSVICSFIAYVSAHDYFYPFTIFNETSFGQTPFRIFVLGAKRGNCFHRAKVLHNLTQVLCGRRKTRI